MNTSIIRLATVQSRTGLSRSGIYRLIQSGQFPKPIKMGVRTSGWALSEVNAWINNKISERDSN